MTTIITLSALVPWLATKSGPYTYTDNCDCAIAQYCKEVLGMACPIVGPHDVADGSLPDGRLPAFLIQTEANDVVQGASWTFRNMDRSWSFEAAFARGLVAIARQEKDNEAKAAGKAQGSSDRRVPICEVQESALSV